MSSLRSLISRVAAFVALCVLACNPAANAAPKPASPASSTQAASTISVLVVGGQNNHDWKIGNEFLITLLKRHGGFSVAESNTPAKDAPAAEWEAWNPQFEKYQCVVLDYNGQMWPPAVMTAFENYVAGGGSVVLVHAANNSFTGWLEYEKMVGLLWRGTNFGASLYLDDAGQVVREEAGQGRPMGHGKQWDWVATVRDPKHPITAGMPLTWKHVKDELYHGQRGPAENVNILMSAFDDAKYQGTGKHEPVVWWVPYGKGKVLTNVMGHVGENSGPLSCVGFQTVFLRSIEWLVTGRCSTPIPANFPTEERTSQRYPGDIPRLPLADLAAQEAMAKIKVPAGYHLELVASDPAIVHPVMCTWDGNGRMYVAEMRSYMLDADASSENEPTSRVSRLIDTNGDGVMDQATAFADNLVLPRMVLPLDDRVIIAETYTGQFVSYRDTTGDGVADEKKVLYAGEPTKANLEHQDTALQWGIDNYIYSGILGRRFRFTGEAMESNQIWGSSSQWGLAMDDLGRFFCSSAGGENPAYGFQQLPIYGNLTLPGETAEGFAETFPAVQTLDTQGGLNRIHSIKGTLNHFTAVAGQSIFRGDRLPKDLVGDYILPEPVGRLIRRAKVDNVEGKRVLTNATPGTEFITSTDLAFRPVWTATGPDGCLYIVDMHHGIIQESAWVTPGSYLRDTVVREGYDKYVGHGRIYRLVADGFKPGPKPNMLNETAAELVAHLSHPNGWWRDTAQKLIVLKGDKSVVPALTKLAETSPSPLGRVHALWTLDGLDATDRALLIRAFSDKDERVRATAVRISEVFLRNGDAELVKLVAPLLKDSSIDVVVQAINSLRYVPAGAARPSVEAAAAAHLGNEIVTASAQQSLQFDPAKPTGIKVNIDPVGLALMKKGQEHFTTICFACHGADGKGVITSDKVQLAPSLAGSPRVIGSPEALVRIVLHGITGDIDGKSYPGAMIPQKANDDLWVAQVLTYIRNSFGNTAPTITPEDVAKIRKATTDRQQPYVMTELALFLAIPREATSKWVFSASENSKEARRALDGDAKSRWSTNKSREEGQWFQFDMGKPFEVSRLSIDTTDSKNDFPKKFELRKSDDGVKWSEPIYSGDGKTVITIDLPPKTVTRFLRVIQKTAQGGFWSIHELGVYGAEPQ
jgi:putative membrane-bound dehydrogenase-like protein